MSRGACLTDVHVEYFGPGVEWASVCNTLARYHVATTITAAAAREDKTAMG